MGADEEKDAGESGADVEVNTGGGDAEVKTGDAPAEGGDAPAEGGDGGEA